MKARTLAATALALGLFAAGPATASEAVSIQLEPAYFTFSNQPGTFATSVRWGRIEVRGHDGYDVRIAARLVGDASRPAGQPIDDLVELRLEEQSNRMALRIDSAVEGFYGVELEVWVPRATRLELEMTGGGEIAVREVLGEVDVANRNGSVDLSGLGSAAVVDARNGSITAEFDRVDPELPMAFSTLNGSVDVTLPERAAASLRVRHTYGGVESDFPLTARDGSPARVRTDDLAKGETRVLSAAINGGGPRYDFYTANGTIYLRKRG